VSYRLLDDSLEKAVKIYDMLVTMTPVHASPFEHIATPMEVPENLESWEWAWEDVSGITHVDKVGDYWSGNLKGWIQYRHLLDNNACWDYNPET
jgi:hypothetical protein